MSGVPPISEPVATLPVSNVLRPAAVVALVVVASVAWVVYGTVERAQDSNQAVVHTQEVLTAIETVLSTLVEAESAGAATPRRIRASRTARSSRTHHRH